jgi:hypothetical protein
MSKLQGEGKSQYDILMFYVSDEFQDLALVYGERLALEQSILSLKKLEKPENQSLLNLHFQIYALDIIIQNRHEFTKLGLCPDLDLK